MNSALRAAVIAEWRGLPDRKMRPDRWHSPAELMPKLMQRLGLRERLRETEVIDAWSKIVGDFIAAHAAQSLTLGAIASHVGTSPFHLQRTFSRLLGISPRAYQDALRARRFRGHLRNGMPLSAAIYDAGYGSSSRVYVKATSSAVSGDPS